MANVNPTPSAAPMAVVNELPHGVQSELAEMRHVIGLAAFAVEARRVLHEIDLAAEFRPDVEVGLRCIEFRRQWTEYPDMTATVLVDVHERLGALLMGRG